ncbi:MAG TPA: PhzF family phenazine biosynthesis protein [Candidatus Dormibacteraeota bacterium]
MPSSRRFSQVDVFTSKPYQGNPVAVVLDGDGVSEDDMRRIARWTNLSETTFVLPPTNRSADYRLRIFTPSGELPFAGHPTLGTCHAWLTHGGKPRDPKRIVQECAAGLIPLRPSAAGLEFAAPPLVRQGDLETEVAADVLRSLRLESKDVTAMAWADNGPGWVAVLLSSADAVLALAPLYTDRKIGVAGPLPAGSGDALEVRAFFPKDGATAEDPVTGSLNASLAQWLIGSGRIKAPYVARQGTALGRAGRVHVTQDGDGSIWIGGGTVTCIEGAIEI